MPKTVDQNMLDIIAEFGADNRNSGKKEKGKSCRDPDEVASSNLLVCFFYVETIIALSLIHI